MDMTITEFCRKHDACREGIRWASKYQSLRDAWDNGDRCNFMLWAATRPGVLSDKELRLFACFCARQNWHLLADPRSRAAVEIAERHANGTATDAELADAAAYAAADASAEAALAAADAAAYAAADAAAYAAAYAEEEAQEEQTDWLRANTSPDFSKE